MIVYKLVPLVGLNDTQIEFYTKQKGNKILQLGFLIPSDLRSGGGKIRRPR